MSRARARLGQAAGREAFTSRTKFEGAPKNSVIETKKTLEGNIF